MSTRRDQTVRSDPIRIDLIDSFDFPSLHHSVMNDVLAGCVAVFLLQQQQLADLEL